MQVIPIEMVVRGYMTGSTETSIWTLYKNGCRNYCGNVLAEGMQKNAKVRTSDALPPSPRLRCRCHLPPPALSPPPNLNT